MEQSFLKEDALGGRQLRALFGSFGNAAVLIEGRTGKSCFKDWNTWVAVRAAWHRLGVSFGPLPPKGWLDSLLEASKASTTIPLEPLKDAATDVRVAYLIEASKRVQALSDFRSYQEDDRVQAALGDEIAASLLTEKTKKGG
jgi:hypothetical protein